jgi:hypothetical protein
MTTTEKTTIETTIDTYFAMWNEPDRAKRLEVIAQAWTAGGHYVDPLSDVTGYEAIADMVEGVRDNYPDATLERTGPIDAHHNVVRFPWRAIATDGADIVAGLDVAVVADDGRLQALAGFFG